MGKHWVAGQSFLWGTTERHLLYRMPSISSWENEDKVGPTEVVAVTSSYLGAGSPLFASPFEATKALSVFCASASEQAEFSLLFLGLLSSMDCM